MAASIRRSPQLALAVGAVVSVLFVGAVLVRIGDTGGDRSPGSKSATAADARDVETGSGNATGAAGTGDAGGTPARSEVDAVAAAISYATAPQRWLYLTDDELVSEMREVATAPAADRLTDEVVAEVTAARERLQGSSGRVWWLVRPLAWRVDHEQGDTARVSVWVITILSAVDVAAPQSEFATVTIDLTWADNTWRVDAVLERPGPTPMTGPLDEPWDAVPFDQALDGFTRIGEEPAQ